MGSVVNSKVGELEDITKERGSSRMRKEVVGFFHAVVGNKIFLVKFEDGQKKEMIFFRLCF